VGKSQEKAEKRRTIRNPLGEKKSACREKTKKGSSGRSFLGKKILEKRTGGARKSIPCDENIKESGAKEAIVGATGMKQGSSLN